MDAVAVLQEKFPLKKITPEKYRTMGSFLMRFHLEQYEVEGLGNLCVLKTRAMLGDRARSDEDVLSYIAFPQVAEKFFDAREEKENRHVKYTVRQID